jgi:hypothetical protein
MSEWWCIEVLHGESVSASAWQDSYSSALIESVISHGALDWRWNEHRWGVVFEVAFPEEENWDRFRLLPQVRAALDAVPDPVNGLLIYRGPGGGAGAPVPRRPRPLTGADAMELPEPTADIHLDLTNTGPDGISLAVG